MIFDDAKALDLDGIHATTASETGPVLWFNQVEDVIVRGCRMPSGVQRFLRITGAASKGVRLFANDLGEVDVAPEVNKSSRGEMTSLSYPL